MIRWPKRCGSSLPNRHRPARRLPKIYPIISADFWLVVASPHPAEAIKTKAPSLSHYFFRHSNRHPKRRVNVLPTRSHQPPPLPTTPSFCSLLCRPNERRTSKTGAPSISHFSMGAISVPQTGKSAAARANPGARRAPVIDS